MVQEKWVDSISTISLDWDIGMVSKMTTFKLFTPNPLYLFLYFLYFGGLMLSIILFTYLETDADSETTNPIIFRYFHINILLVFSRLLVQLIY